MSDRIWVPPGGSADPPREEPPRAGAGEPSEQELADRYREELKRLKVSDLVLQTLYTISSLGFAKLSPESRDLPQARLAIESMRALLPVLEGEVPEDALRDFKQVVANMQVAFAEAAKQQAPPKRPAGAEDAPQTAPSDESL